MKSIILKTALAFVAGASLVSCGDFGDINDNPNKPTSAYTSYLFSNEPVILHIFGMTSAILVIEVIPITTQYI